MSRQSTNIEIKGVKQTIKALDAFEPEIKKRLNKTIREALEVVKAGAESRYPAGAWVIRINKKNILGSVVARGGGARGKSWADSDGGIKAAVFEFAGTQNSGANPQAAGMIESLNRRYGQPGRFLWASWDSNGAYVLDTIRDAVYIAERELQAKLDATGEEY